jgi:hypothetical protein
MLRCTPYMMLSISFMLYDDVGCIDRCIDVSHLLLLLSSNVIGLLLSAKVQNHPGSSEIGRNLRKIKK